MGIKMNVIKLISLGFFMLLIIACDGKVYVEVYIDNESDYDLELHYSVGGNENKSIAPIQNGTSILIHSYEISVLHSELSAHIKYIELYYQDSLVYQQYPIDETMWEREWIDDGETSSYTLFIDNEDLNINDN